MEAKVGHAVETKSARSLEGTWILLSKGFASWALLIWSDTGSKVIAIDIAVVSTLHTASIEGACSNGGWSRSGLDRSDWFEVHRNKQDPQNNS